MALEILSKDEIFKGKFTSLWATKFLDKNGNEKVWEWMKKKDFVAVLPITKQQELIVVKNYRVPIEKYCYQTVAGTMDKDSEDYETAAKRELLEETGYVADKFIPLKPCLNAPGSLSNTLYPFIALGAHRVNENAGDTTEDIEVIKIPADELYNFYNNCPDDCDFSYRIIAMYEIGKNLGLL